MELNNFQVKFDNYREIFEKYAIEFFNNNFNTEQKLLDAVKYSFFAGGKRIRPVLMLAVGEVLGVENYCLLPFALAIECIHTYSLIHDDLPAMDNDDYRRGKLTNHKVFGDAIAILAGDALLNLAFSIMSNECLNSDNKNTVKAMLYVSDCAGISGMIGGQACDIISENNKTKSENSLKYIVLNKTAKLIAAAISIPAILADNKFDIVNHFGFILGEQFQIVDDVLDVESSLAVLGKSVGKDYVSGKLTHVSLYGMERCKELVAKQHNEAINIIQALNNNEFLLQFCDYLRMRIK